MAGQHRAGFTLPRLPRRGRAGGRHGDVDKPEAYRPRSAEDIEAGRHRAGRQLGEIEVDQDEPRGGRHRGRPGRHREPARPRGHEGHHRRADDDAVRVITRADLDRLRAGETVYGVRLSRAERR